MGCNDQWAFLHSPAKERWLFGGNRSGKTETAVVDAIWLATGQHVVRSEQYKPPVYLRFISTSWENGIEKIILPKFQEMVKRSNLKGGSWETGYRSHVLTFKNGSTVDFMTSEQQVNKHGGVKRHAIYLDEHHPKSYYDESIMRLIDYGGYLVGSMTPEEGITWEADHVQNPPKGIDIDYWHFWTEKNPHLSADGVAEVKALIRDPKLQAAKLRGEFIPLYGMVYPMFNASLLIVPDFEIPKHWYRVCLIDPHLRKFTAILWAAWSPDGDCIIYRTRKVKKTVKELASYIRVESAGEKIETWIGDEAMGGDGKNIFGEDSVLRILNSLGLPFMPTSQASDKAFEAGVNKVQTYLTPDPVSGKPALRIFESCNTGLEWIDGRPTGSILWEFKRYRFRKEQKSDEETFREKVATVDDDYLDLVRYGLMAGPQDQGEITVLNTVSGEEVDPYTGW